MWGGGDTGGVAVTSQGITVINTCVGGAGEGVRLKQGGGGGKSELSGGSQFLLLYLD